MSDSNHIAYPVGENELQTRRLITQSQLYDSSTRAFFQAAGIGRGMKVLELGSGVGDVSLVLAELVGPSGRVISVELNAAAVAAAQARITTVGWRNVTCLVGDIASIPLDQDFDAVVGRFILMWLSNPVAVLERVVKQVRPGGIIAFQDNDFTFNILTSAPMPTLDTLTASMKNVPEVGVPDFHMGLKMHQLYQQVGLPTPQLTLDAPLGTGSDWTGYQYLAETFAMMMPALQQRGIMPAAQIDTANLAERMRQEALENQAVIVLPAVIGAWSRKPVDMR